MNSKIDKIADCTAIGDIKTTSKSFGFYKSQILKRLEKIQAVIKILL